MSTLVETLPYRKYSREVDGNNSGGDYRYILRGTWGLKLNDIYPDARSLPCGRAFYEKHGFAWIDRVNDNVFLTMKHRYAWDGGTGVIWQTKNTVVSSLGHDAFCEFINTGLLPISQQKNADRMYYNLCLLEGMSMLRAEIHYASIKTYSFIKHKGKG